MKDQPELDNRPFMIIMGNELTNNSKRIRKWLYYWDTMLAARR
jgi:hypothetical protein